MLSHVKVQGSFPSFRVIEKQDTLGQSCLSSPKAIHLHRQYVLLHPAFAAWLGTFSHWQHLGPQHITALQRAPGIRQPRAQLLPGRVLSVTGLFEWVTDLMQGLSWSKPSRTFGSLCRGNFPHTKYKGSVSYSEQQTLLRERKKHKVIKILFFNGSSAVLVKRLSWNQSSRGVLPFPYSFSLWDRKSAIAGVVILETMLVFSLVSHIQFHLYWQTLLNSCWPH